MRLRKGKRQYMLPVEIRHIESAYLKCGSHSFVLNQVRYIEAIKHIEPDIHDNQIVGRPLAFHLKPSMQGEMAILTVSPAPEKAWTLDLYVLRRDRL